MSRAAILDTLGDLLDAGLARHDLRGCARLGRSPRVTGRLWVHGAGEVIVGDRVFFDAERAPIELYAREGARIVVGDDSYLGGGTSIEATGSIELGARTRLGSFCKVMDNHFHPLVGDRHVCPAPRPVVIEDDVVLGNRTIVLAGAHIARGTHIAASTVVKSPRRTDKTPDPPMNQATVGPELPVNSAYLAKEALRVATLLATDRAAAYLRVDRGVGVLRAAVLLRGCERGELVNAKGYVRVVPGGRIRVGDRVQLAGGMISTELVCRPGGELVLGARSIINYGCSLHAARSVRIGERCMLGSLVRIHDAGERGAAPVVVGDDVWIAHGAVLEPGVTIGRGSVVSAGSVVQMDVPEDSLAYGVPAVSVPLRGVPVRN